jgi:hypothetical protein
MPVKRLSGLEEPESAAAGEGPPAPSGATPAGPTVAVLVPCRDEEATVADVVTGFLRHLPGARVYVFDNGSADATAERAAAAGAVVRFVAPRGKGNVVRRMLADVEADVYVLVDGDGTYDPAVAPSMVEAVESGYDLVNARRLPLARTAFPRGHRLGNRVLGSLVRRGFQGEVGDLLSGYKAFSRRLAKSFPVHSRGFEIETELAVHALELGAPTLEIGGAYRARPTGSPSKLGTLRDGWRIAWTILALLRQGRPLAYFTVLAGVLSASSVALGIPLVLQYLHTHLVPRLPTAVLATGLMILAALAFTAGVVLDSVARARREQRMLAYLAVPGPRAASEARRAWPPGGDAQRER